MFINFYVCLHCRGRVVTKDVRACESISIQRVKYEIEPVHEITNNEVCVTSKASDQPAHTLEHTHSLIRAFASHSSIL